MEIFSKETMEIVGRTLAGLGDNAQNAFIAYLSVPVLLELVYWIGLCVLTSVIFKWMYKIVTNKPTITISKPVAHVVSLGDDAKLVRFLRLHKNPDHVEAYGNQGVYSSVFDAAHLYIQSLETAAGNEVVKKLRKDIFQQD